MLSYVNNPANMNMRNLTHCNCDILIPKYIFLFISGTRSMCFQKKKEDLLISKR